MKKKFFNKKLYAFYFSALILTIFTIRYLIVKNYEFLTYTVTIGLLIYLLIKSDDIFNYGNIAKWGFAVWLFFHLAGGTFSINGTRWYDSILVNIVGDPFFILKYDQAIHILCYFVITLFIYSIVSYVTNIKTNNLKKKINISFGKMDKFSIGLVVFLSGMGVSAINEIIEFGTVAFFGATGVGGYYNNALDLVFNAMGCLLAIFFMKNHKKK